MACRFYMRNKLNAINYALSYNGLIFSSENKSLASLRSMAVLSSRAQERRSDEIFAREARENERRSREKNKNRLPGFVAFSTAAPFNSF